MYEFAAGDRPVARVMSSVTTETRLDITVRYDNGRDDIVNFDVTSAGTRAAALFREGGDDRFEFPGRVTSLSVDALGITKRGQYYIHIFLERADVTKLISLGAFYVTSTFFGGLGHFEHSVGGRGHIQTITGTNPAAGDEITEVVPANALWKLLGFSAVLVTDGTGANRRPYLIVDDGAATNRRWFVGNASANVQTATLTRTWMFWEGVPLSLDGAYELLVDTQTILTGGFFPKDTFLVGGDRIRTVTQEIVAGDDYAAPIFQVEEWLTE